LSGGTVSLEVPNRCGQSEIWRYVPEIFQSIRESESVDGAEFELESVDVLIKNQEILDLAEAPMDFLDSVIRIDIQCHH